MFDVYCFESHICIVTEGFGALDMHLLMLLLLDIFRALDLCECGGGGPKLPAPSSPYGLLSLRT